nr:winged helix-turn-helix transcriptional regulator [Nocardioides thalensis]
MISHTWDPVVLATLRGGAAPRRDLLRSIGGISDKSLHESLVRLIDAGLVSRVADSGSTYDLTPLGTSFATGPLLALARWAEEHAVDLVGAA